MKKIITRFLFYVSALILAVWFITSLIAFRVEVPTSSMQNTIQINQQLLVLKDKFVQQYNRGDIVVFEQDGTLLIKRLIGLPGETIRISKGTVFVDGELLFEEYLSSNSDEYDKTFYVPEGSYLFLGDNREESFDARFWDNPYVNKNDLWGKAIYYIYPKFEQIKEINYESI